MAGIILVIASVAFVLICAFLILLVLIQPGKSGGLASMTTSHSEGPAAFTETLGIERTDKAMFRWTAGLAIGFFVLTLTLTFLGNMRDRAQGQLNLPDAPKADTNVVTGAAPSGTNTVSIPVTPVGDSNAATPPANGSEPPAESEKPE